MDFNDTPQEAEFRKKVRSFLEANAEKRSIIFWLKYFFDDGDNLYLPAFLKVNDKSSLFP